MYNVWLQIFEAEATNHLGICLLKLHRGATMRMIQNYFTAAWCDFNKAHFVFRFELAWAFCPSLLQFPLPAFERGHCYEPYLQNGNFTTTDPLYGVGAVVQFTCDPGHALEQGPPVIECISARDPYWNDTEPLCKGNTEPCAGVFSSLYLEPLSFPCEVNSQANHLFEQKMAPDCFTCGDLWWSVVSRASSPAFGNQQMKREQIISRISSCSGS